MVKMMGWKKRFHTSGKRAGVAIFVLEKISHYIMIKGKIHQSDITALNIHVPNIEH